MACTNCKQRNKKTTDKIVSTSVADGEFKLRQNIGVLQINFGSGQFISPDNCNKELAIEFLKANPNRISLFESYPADWKELISDILSIEKTEDIQEAAGEIIVANKASKKARGGSKSK